MPKITKTGKKKENSVEKRKRRENTRQAREQARRFLLPALVLFVALLVGLLFLRYGTGKSLSKEAIERRRQRNQFSKMMRENAGDYDKLKSIMKDNKQQGANVNFGEDEANSEAGVDFDLSEKDVDAKEASISEPVDDGNVVVE